MTIVKDKVKRTEKGLKLEVRVRSHDSGQIYSSSQSV